MILRSMMLNQTTFEGSGVSEVTIVYLEHKVHMEDELPIQTPIVVQSVQFEGWHLSLELEQSSGVSKEYSSLSCISLS